MNLASAQREICKRFHSPFIETPAHLKVGVSKNIGEDVWPVHGFRHLPEGDTSGWYIWAGEAYSDAPDFFLPLHASHLKVRCPRAEKFLGLAPGWRFLFDATYEDVWFDETLLRTS